MTTETITIDGTDHGGTSRWDVLADQILGGHELTVEQGQTILESDDAEILDLMAAAYRIRRRAFGSTVQLYFLINAKSGLCPEDCGYCSQSKVATSPIEKYNLLSRETLLDGAREAAKRGARTYCMVISARGPNDREISTVEAVVPEIKEKYGLKICTSLGLLKPEDVTRLKACGVDRVNHNLNTSESFYREICTTHNYEDRLDTLRAVKTAGLEICCGGIVGMGERPLDIVYMAIALREIGVDSIPVNFLIPIKGTSLEDQNDLNPRYCLKVLALTRFANPDTEIRVAAGRERHLGSLQPLSLYAANSLFVGDYLTTKGQPPAADYKMIEEMGFVVTKESHVEGIGKRRGKH